MKHEFVTVVQEPLAVDRLVVPDRQIAGQSGGGAGRLAIDGDRLDPVNDVLELQVERAACATSSAVQGSEGFEPTFRNSDPVGLRTRAAAATQVPVHCRYSSGASVSR